MVPADYLAPCLPMKHGTQAKMWKDGKGLVLKDMRGGNLNKVRAEWDMQGAVYRACKQVPKLFQLAGPFFLMEDLGESEPITDMHACLQAATDLLGGLHEAGVVHGDLRIGNIIIKQNRPFALDFGWAKIGAEQAGDAVMLGNTLQEIYDV